VGKRESMRVSILGTNIVLNDDPDLDGITLTIFFAGCPHNCFNCHNPEGRDIDNGTLIKIEELKEKIRESSVLIKSLCFCGGEPLTQKEALICLSRFAKDYGLKTIMYTGYLFEDISDDIRNVIDVIIDGQYIDDLRQNTFPASSNQRMFRNNKQADVNELRINGGV